MKLPSLLVIACLICSRVLAEDVCLFNQIDVPRNEARLLELARVVEFRCECVLPPLNDDSQFVAERYQNGECVSRQLFSFGKFGRPSKGKDKGVISFGWHMDDQKLVGVHDTGYFHQAGFAKLPEFHSARPIVWKFFKESRAEAKTTTRGQSIDLYPILGIRGAKSRSIRVADKDGRVGGFTVEGKTGDLSALTQEQLTNFFKKLPDAIIVYLVFSSGGPDLDFEK